MTDHVSASASFAAPVGQAEAPSAELQSEVSPEDSAQKTPAVHSVPLTEGSTAEAGSGEAEYGPPPQTFVEMGLHADVQRALTEMGFVEPMPVQRRVYRPLSAGRDLIVQSRTGSGKTAAFGIPFVQSLVDPTVTGKDGHIQALVLGPTRELALQVATEVGRIATHRGVIVTAVYGGAPMGKQIEALKAGSHVVAGTPGRVLDHLRRGTLHLNDLRIVVLDEADEMLSMGFLEDILEVLKRCPAERQTLLFSATMPDEVVRISQRHLKSPLMLQLSADFVGVNEITHAYYMVSGMGRNRDLLRVLQIERPDSAMIFCNTREETGHVAEFLRSQGLDAEPISSDLTQAERERVMGRMKKKNLHYLVATDVAARGIDISDLSHVINYTFPESAEVYIHRTGRTGRAGKAGIAISLISPRELGNFYYLKLTYKIRPEERTLPSEAELQTLREGQYLDRLTHDFANRKPAGEFRSFLKRVMASEEGERLMSLLLEQYLGRPASETAHGGHGHAHGHGARHSHGTASETAHAPAPHDRDSGREPGRERRPPREREPGREREGSRDEHRRSRSHREDDGQGDRGRRRSSEPRRRDEGREPAPPAEAAPRAAEAEPSANADRRSSSEAPRQQRRRSSRPAGPPAAAAAQGSAPPAPTNSPDDIIHVEDGRDFWEAWVDARKVPGEAAASSSEVAPVPPGAAEVEGEAEGEGRGRRRRRERSEYVPAPGEARLYLNLGRRDQLTEEVLVDFLTQHGVTKLPIELHSTHTYLYAPEAQAEHVIAALHGKMHGQRAVQCERARR
jgi:ATP-dependent RNA helicase DeaD